jgi:hypothetical protein
LVGEFLTVSDTSPNPPLVQANYIVTAVTHETEKALREAVYGADDDGEEPGAPTREQVSVRERLILAERILRGEAMRRRQSPGSQNFPSSSPLD